MSNKVGSEPMKDLFIFETLQLIEELEQSILNSEKSNGIVESINEIFRIMHTIKGSSSMMRLENIAMLSHLIEDLFYYIRENKLEQIDDTKLTDLVLDGLDFIKVEVGKIEIGQPNDGDATQLSKQIKDYLNIIKESSNIEGKSQMDEDESCLRSSLPINNNYEDYSINLFFQDGCGMENIRAFEVVHKLSEIAWDIDHIPKDLFKDELCADTIAKEGLRVSFKSHQNIDQLKLQFRDTFFLKSFDISQEKLEKIVNEKSKVIILDELEEKNLEKTQEQNNKAKIDSVDLTYQQTKHSHISVSVPKLDLLMDIVGELVISEALVTQHPELMGVPLSNFYKAARQLQKITTDLQDIVMSIRMVALSATFQKMNRLVRDMSMKLGKIIKLQIVGEETEVDKNIIEHISDPLMHIIRNSIDHGIESAEQRNQLGKPKEGTITLEAKNVGSEVWIIVKDDGKGLNKKEIIEKAQENGLINKPLSELTDHEIYGFIFHAGFSTKEKVTEFSGRGVGMDVVSKSIEKIRGTVQISSIEGSGTTIIIKIPLTLAIIDGMNIQVGHARYTIPVLSIKESFRLGKDNIITDDSGNEMIMLRGQCLPIIKLYEYYNIDNAEKNIDKGIMILVENESQYLCLFADALLGEQQVVVKALPNYINNVKGIAGCTLLGDGGISLILDITGLMSSIF
ncbi:MAG: chemotaxis protein CheA [Firmicutes bacterium HGW-Firmicutes-1]|nr:MAG: chemotaxis protein CheA [Firmicutes bacterium HGW-Firmicutes-1]